MFKSFILQSALSRSCGAWCGSRAVRVVRAGSFKSVVVTIFKAWMVSLPFVPFF